MYVLPWFQFTTIHLGPIPIQVWGFFVALGMAVSILIISKRAKRVGENPEHIIDLALWAIIGGLIFARLFHVFLYEPTFYLNNPLEIIKVWHGGLSSFGGLFGAVVGFVLFEIVCKYPSLQVSKHLKLANLGTCRLANSQFLKIADLLAFAAVYGWIIGRIGCVMIHDHPGMPCNCFLAFRWSDGTPRLDMAFLEILAMIPLAILFYIKSKKQSQTFLSILFIYYGILRFILDFFRATDVPGADARYLGLTPAQYFAILLVFCGGYLLIKTRSVTQVLRPDNKNKE